MATGDESQTKPSSGPEKAMEDREEEDRVLKEALEQAEQFKSEGNEAFKKGDNTEAVRLYTMAIDLDPENHIYYSNRCAAFLAMGDAKSKALKDAEKCMELKKDWVKSYLRLGAAQFSLNRFEAAMDTYREGLRRFAEDKSLSEALERARAAGLAHSQQLRENAKREAERKEAAEKHRQELLARTRAEAAASKAAADAAATGGGETATADDLLGSFLAKVKDATEGAVENATETKSKEKTKAEEIDLGTAVSQIDRLLQPNYKWKNLNPFYVLLLSHDATVEDIKQRYRKISSLIHPDKCPDSRARDAFEEVKKAYEQLQVETKRVTIQKTIENCHKRVDKERRMLKAKGMKESQLGNLADAYRKEVLKAFGEIEHRRKKIEKLQQAQRKREADQHEEDQEKLKEMFTREKSWAEENRREKRVGNWRDFQKGGKKKKKLASGWKEEEREHGKIAMDGGANSYRKAWK